MKVNAKRSAVSEGGIRRVPFEIDLAGDEVLSAVRRDSDGALVMMLSPFALSHDPGAWGLFLADLAEHVANAYDGSLSLPTGEKPTREEILGRVREMFDKEWAHRTSPVISIAKLVASDEEEPS